MVIVATCRRWPRGRSTGLRHSGVKHQTRTCITATWAAISSGRNLGRPRTHRRFYVIYWPSLSAPWGMETPHLATWRCERLIEPESPLSEDGISPGRGIAFSSLESNGAARCGARSGIVGDGEAQDGLPRLTDVVGRRVNVLVGQDLLSDVSLGYLLPGIAALADATRVDVSTATRQIVPLER